MVNMRNDQESQARSHQELSARIRGAIEQRANLPLAIACLRLVDGSGDNLPGLYIDRFGPVIIAHLHPPNPVSETDLRAALISLETELEALGITSGVLWVHHKGGRSERGVPRAATQLFGETPAELVVAENEISYVTRPTQQINAGLFLDTRELRSWIRANSNGKKVLNTFCFTGSLGLAALTGGAREVVQVDNSKAALRWTDQNIKLAENSRFGDLASRSRLICEDTRSFMERELRRLESAKIAPYDLVIIDPPSFGAAGASFSLTRDMGHLLRLAFQISAPDAAIVATCNLGTLRADDICELLQESAATRGCKVVELARILPPSEDFRASERDSISVRGARITFSQLTRP